MGCFSRISVGSSSPSYFFFQLNVAAWLIPACTRRHRDTSKRGSESAPK
jgi:hypothetical protein